MRVRVRVPATSANLGPGFDALGLALALHSEFTLEECDGVALSVEGEGHERLPRSSDNVVARAARLAFDTAQRPFRGIAIHCVNRIPLSRGLGSSAAAWVGGLLGANALIGEPLDRASVLALAAAAEGHPDNVAAAIFGGLTVSCQDGSRIAAVTLPVPVGLRWVVLIPTIESATRDARAVLPEAVPRSDAVFNVQRVSLFLAAMAGHPELLDLAMRDRLHQPYRRRLFPWMDDVMAAARDAGALGCVLSGAGPSMLAVTQAAPEPVAKAMEDALHAAGVSGRAIALEVDRAGAGCAMC